MSSSQFEAVVAVLRAQSQHPLPDVTPESQLNSLGLDSLELMEFVFAVEDHFQLRIPEHLLDPRQAEITLADLCAAITAALALKTPSSGTN